MHALLRTLTANVVLLRPGQVNIMQWSLCVSVRGEKHWWMVGWDGDGMIERGRLNWRGAEDGGVG